MTIYQSYNITTDLVEIKFADLIDPTTLVNANFVVSNVGATPAVVATAPFQTISTTRDYYSTPRLLRLYWNTGVLTADTFYSLTISNLKDVLGNTIPTEVILFDTVDVAIGGTPVEEPPTRVPVDVEDYSIKDISIYFPPSLLGSSTSQFRIVSIKPTPENAAYLNSSYNEGRIEIEFNDEPAANFISTQYFKVEKKLFGQGLARWETVDALVTSNLTLVMIYLPSDDEPSLYGEPDKVYYEEGYKYRLRISAEVGPAILSLGA